MSLPVIVSPDDEDAGLAASSLRVGRNVTFLLAGDALKFRDETSGPASEKSKLCLPLRRRGSSIFRFGRHYNELAQQEEDMAVRTIPLSHVLWAELTDEHFKISYAKPLGNGVVPAHLKYPAAAVDKTHASSWIELLLRGAYGTSQLRKRIKVLINPAGGRGRATAQYAQAIEPILAAARSTLDVQTTQRVGHAGEICRALAIDRFDVVACCSGDGLPHEVFNGLAQRPDARAALATLAIYQIPCGSGNALSWNLAGTGEPSVAALRLVKGMRTSLDLVSITQGERRFLSFMSQSAGMIAECDLGSEWMRFLGEARFKIALVGLIARKKSYMFDVSAKIVEQNKSAIRDAYNAERARTLAADADPDASASAQQKLPGPDGPPADTGLPPLRFGTINGPLPPQLTPLSEKAVATTAEVGAGALSTFWAGTMAHMAGETNIFPASLPSDGRIDVVSLAADVPRRRAIANLLAVDARGRGFFARDDVRYAKVEAYRFTPETGPAAPPAADGFLSIDGESYPLAPFQAEVHKGLGTVLSRTGRLYETEEL